MMHLPKSRWAVVMALLLAGIFGAEALGQSPTGTLKILSVEPTVLFPKSEPLRQLAYVHVLNGGVETMTGSVRLELNKDRTQTEAVLHEGETVVSVLMPDIEVPGRLAVEIIGKQGEVLASYAQTWQPQRKWKVYVVQSSHEDLGYEGTIFVKEHENANWIDIAARLSDPTKPMGSKDYHYTIETIVGARNYISERSSSAWRSLAESQIKTGNMSLMGAPSGVHSHWMDYEEIMRMTYPMKRAMRDRYGIDTDTFMIVDNPSISNAGAQSIADAGFKYIARWGQGWRTGGNNDYAHTKLPAIFWWQTPDRTHRILYTWRSHYMTSLWFGAGFNQTEFLTAAAAEMNRTLKRIEDGEELGPYPYDAAIFPHYYDHGIPYNPVGLLENWDAKFAYPKISVTNPSDFFHYIENHYAASLPTLKGDLNNFSADYATIDPESQGWKRRATRLLPFYEGMQTMASYLDPSRKPTTAEVANLWTTIYDYDEHSWPTLPKAEDMHVFNVNYVKRESARYALHRSTALFDDAAHAVTSNIRGRSNTASIAVWNSLAHQQDGPVFLPSGWDCVLDAANGLPVPMQHLSDGQTAFIAKQIPPFGYKIYTRGATKNVSVATPSRGSEISNAFYTIKADPASGAIISIFDRKMRRELVDASSKYTFNQFIYIHKNDKESLAGTEHTASKVSSFKVETGAVRSQMVIHLQDDQTNAEIVQTVTLYAGIPRIDFQNTVRHAAAMFDFESADRYKENIFFAFPLDVPGGTATAEYPGGVVRPYDDQLRWGSHDYLSANRWVDVSNGTFGISIAPWNEQIFQFGEIRYNQFSIDYKPSSSSVFGYAWSNRMTGLFDLDEKHPEFTVGYSLSSHSGDWNSQDAAQELGWSVASPLTAVTFYPRENGMLDAVSQSFASVDAPNVQLTVIKQSEQPGRGWIVRLAETAGNATKVRLTLPLLPFGRASLCDAVEDDISPLPVKNHSVEVPLPPFGVATVRLAATNSPGAVQSLSAKAISGETVQLSWMAASGSVGYNVYRSDDPKDPATAEVLVGRSTDPSFTDKHLMPSATYYYRVAAVSAENIQGDASKQISITTQKENREAPPAITDITVTALRNNRKMVSWKKSEAADLRSYSLYRCDGAVVQGCYRKIATLMPSGYSIETYIEDEDAQDQQSHYYVTARDWAGNESPRP